MVSLKGIFLRSSGIIPEPREVFFSCSLCDYYTIVPVENNRSNFPTKCKKCGDKHTMEIIYNLGQYADKQYVKFQERPDEIPEGETPINVDLIVFDDLVDECKPGD